MNVCDVIKKTTVIFLILIFISFPYHSFSSEEDNTANSSSKILLFNELYNRLNNAKFTESIIEIQSTQDFIKEYANKSLINDLYKKALLEGRYEYIKAVLSSPEAKEDGATNEDITYEYEELIDFLEMDKGENDFPELVVQFAPSLANKLLVILPLKQRNKFSKHLEFAFILKRQKTELNRLRAKSKILDAKSKILDAEGKIQKTELNRLYAEGKRLDAEGKRLDASIAALEKIGL